MTKHPHADEHRRPSVEKQLEGASLFETTAPIAKDPPPGPHRVSRRSMTQDAAHGQAMANAKPMRERIYDHLLGILPAGQTREEIGVALRMKLQTVCGRVNDLLTWEVDELPAPRVREGDRVKGSALVYAIPPAVSHSHTHGQ